ncbi:hypothetical protein B0T10DRAFT_549674 [Thelonectria olida]|uniref:Uncharacterized protein n=1 Tax=Thelonectria olida TaxID=1576542 RepID=A0A9P9ARH4_9HYPO|nr:hypothetical protein B0T10DRAFT_549674 [Thelonectria olida]
MKQLNVTFTIRTTKEHPKSSILRSRRTRARRRHRSRHGSTHKKQRKREETRRQRRSLNGSSHGRGHQTLETLPRSDSSLFDDREGYEFADFLASENTPLVEEWDGDSDEEEGVVEFFMNVAGSREEEVDLVLSFCPNETIRELESGSSALNSDKSCLLDDHSNDGTSSTPRDYLGPLTASELQSELQEERFVGQTDHDMNLSMRQPRSQISADRRLIYMTNLNRLGVIALITTASSNEASVLRGALVRHLSFASHLSVRVCPIGFPCHELAFDFPFYVWVRRDKKPEDPRLKRDGTPLRQVLDLSFLSQSDDLPDPPKADYLCKAHISVSILKIDIRRWVVYCFLDTYYDNSLNQESVEKYHSLMESNGFRVDPLTHGRLSANTPILDPWEYFWTVFGIRIRQVKDKWMSLIYELDKRVKTYIETSPLNTIPLPPRVLEQSLHWIRQTQSLLFDLTETLTTMIETWKSFKPCPPFSIQQIGRQHGPIEDAFTELGKCVNTLNSLRKRCDGFRGMIALHMNGEGNRDTKIATIIAQSTKTGTNYMIYLTCGIPCTQCVFPLTLTTGVLSMQESAIPAILGPTKLSFIVLSIISVVLVYVSLALLDRWDRIRLCLEATGQRLLGRFGRLKMEMNRPKAREEDEEQGVVDHSTR